MHSKNRDAKPDCALRKRREITRQKGGGVEQTGERGGLGVVVAGNFAAFVTFGCFFRAGSLHQTVGGGAQANTRRLCCASELPYASQQQQLAARPADRRGSRGEWLRSRCGPLAGADVWESVPNFYSLRCWVPVLHKVNKNTRVRVLRKVGEASLQSARDSPGRGWSCCT